VRTCVYRGTYSYIYKYLCLSCISKKTSFAATSHPTGHLPEMATSTHCLNPLFSGCFLLLARIVICRCSQRLVQVPAPLRLVKSQIEKIRKFVVNSAAREDAKVVWRGKWDGEGDSNLENTMEAGPVFVLFSHI
jgi:hypothetical protein